MNSKVVIFVILAAIAGFVSGFVLANKLNGSEMDVLRSQVAQTPPPATAGPQDPSEVTLSDEEVRRKIAEADDNPNNFQFQKDLGTALYRYGAMKQDLALLGQSIRILQRARDLNAKDFDVIVALGNAQFDTGFFKSNKDDFEKARKSYAQALEIKPNDADVLTDIGISYFVQTPPDLARAAAELEKVAKFSPGHTRSLQFLVRTMVKQNRLNEAEAMLARLKDLNPGNTAIPELAEEISNSRRGTSQ